MKKTSVTVVVVKGSLALILLSGCVKLNASPDISKGSSCSPTTQAAGVSQTRMGVYVALAEVSFEALQKGDVVTSAKVGQALEKAYRVGDQKELSKTNLKLAGQIAQAIDDFVNPGLFFVCGDAKSNPTPSDVKPAYEKLINLLHSADDVR